MGGGWGGQRQSDSRRGVSGKTSAGCLGSQCKGPGAGCARGVLKTASRPGVGEPSGGGGRGSGERHSRGTCSVRGAEWTSEGGWTQAGQQGGDGGVAANRVRPAR